MNEARLGGGVIHCHRTNTYDYARPPMCGNRRAAMVETPANFDALAPTEQCKRCAARRAQQKATFAK